MNKNSNIAVQNNIKLNVKIIIKLIKYILLRNYANTICFHQRNQKRLTAVTTI
jgi:hypothetical protein